MAENTDAAFTWASLAHGKIHVVLTQQERQGVRVFVCVCATEKEKGRLFWRVWRGEHWCGMAAKTDGRLLLLCSVQTQSRVDDTAGLWQSTFYGSVCLLECTLLRARFHSTFSLYLWQYFTSSHQYGASANMTTWRVLSGPLVHEDDESIPVRGTLGRH